MHALQIEVNRALYMDERHVRRASGLATLARDLRAVIEAVGALRPGEL